ncbi:YmdB family metallophosphoesterase [bacterium]|nr:YmdB family metallophosphoesterase [bacterium]MBU1154156.1 YmdB family metallophosphoesterase [bacterium]MBU1782164.1 YmdB family metallophosphoesterase [bacterium]
MKVLFIGDVAGECGRKTIATYLPKLKKEHNLDFIVR